MNTIPHKLCRRCADIKPLSDFSPNPTSMDGYFNQCKMCIRYRCVPDEEYFKGISQGLRYCSKCKTWKPISEITVSSDRLEGIGSHCYSCHRVISVDYNRRNKMRCLQNGNEWRRRNRDRHLGVRRQWRAANADRERRRYREWASRNADNHRERARRRRIQKTGNGGSHTLLEWVALCERYEYRCLACGRQKKLTRDHIIPISRAGRDDIENIQPLCRPCNSRKGQQTIDYRPRWAIDAEVS